MADFKRYSYDDTNNEKINDTDYISESDDNTINAREAVKEIINKDVIAKANEILEKYKQGKTSLNNKIIENEKWWKQRHWDILLANDEAGNPKEIEPVSAWLFNCMMAKYSDYMESYPMPNILPREKADEKEAKKLSQIIPVVMEQADFENTYSDEQWYKLKTGTSCYAVIWNADKHNGLGDIDIKKMELLNLYWEPGITDIQDSENVFFLSLINKDKLLAEYPELIGKNLASGYGQQEYEYDDSIDNSEKALVVEWYYKKINESGNVVLHYVKYCGDNVIYATENNEEYKEVGIYNHGLYPFVFETMFPIETSICGLSYIDICKEPQKYIDKLYQVALKLGLMQKARVIVRRDSGLNVDEYIDWENDVVNAEGNLNDDAMRFVPVPDFNGNILSLIDAKINEMKDTTGNTDVSNGSGVPSGITAASAIAAMQEAAGKTSRSQIKTSWRAYKDIIYLVIELIRQFYDTPRQFRITGEDGQTEFIDYSNEGIVPQSQGDDLGVNAGLRLPLFDVEVTIQKQTTYSKMEQNELALNFFKLGFFNPQMSDQALACLDVMDFEHKDKVIDKIQLNGTMFQQMQQMQMQMAQMSAMLAQLTNGQVNPMMQTMEEGAEMQQPMPSGQGEINLDGTGEGGVTERARQQQQASITPN